MDPLLNTFLTRLVMRSFGEADVIQPLLASFFGWESWPSWFSESVGELGFSESIDESSSEPSNAKINSIQKLNFNSQAPTSSSSNLALESNLESPFRKNVISEKDDDINRNSHDVIPNDFILGIVRQFQDGQNPRSSKQSQVNQNFPASLEGFGISPIEASIEADFPAIVPPQRLVRSNPVSSSTQFSYPGIQDQTQQQFSPHLLENPTQRSSESSTVHEPQSDWSNPETIAAFPDSLSDSSIQSSANPPFLYHPTASSSSSIEPSQGTSIIPPNSLDSSTLEPQVNSDSISSSETFAAPYHPTASSSSSIEPSQSTSIIPSNPFNPPSLEPHINPDPTSSTDQDFGSPVSDSTSIDSSTKATTYPSNQTSINLTGVEPNIPADRATLNPTIPHLSVSSTPSESIIQRKATESSSSSPITSDFSSSNPSIEAAASIQNNSLDSLSNHLRNSEIPTLENTSTDFSRSLSQRLTATTEGSIQPAIGFELASPENNPEQAFASPDTNSLTPENPASHSPSAPQPNRSISPQNPIADSPAVSSVTRTQSSNLSTSSNQPDATSSSSTEIPSKSISQSSQSLQVQGYSEDSSEHLQNLSQIQPNLPEIAPTFESSGSPIAPTNEFLTSDSALGNTHSIADSNPSSSENTAHLELSSQNPIQEKSQTSIEHFSSTLHSTSQPISKSIQPIVPGLIEFLERSPWDLDNSATSESQFQDSLTDSLGTSPSQTANPNAQTHLAQSTSISETSASSDSATIQPKIEPNSFQVLPNTNTHNNSQTSSSSLPSPSNPNRAVNDSTIETTYHPQQQTQTLNSNQPLQQKAPQILNSNQSIQPIPPTPEAVYHSSANPSSASTENLNSSLTSSIGFTSSIDNSIDPSNLPRITPSNHPESSHFQTNPALPQASSAHLTQRSVSHSNLPAREAKHAIRPNHTPFSNTSDRSFRADQASTEPRQQKLIKARSQSTIKPLFTPLGSPASSAALPISTTKSEPTIIEITIGKIEVRGISKTATSSSRSQAQSQRPPMSLDHYLQQRNEEAR